MKRPVVVFHPSPHMIAAVDELFAELAPAGTPIRNVVQADLLDRAARGVTAELQAEVKELLGGIETDPDPVILCSCSTYGGYSEELGASLGKDVIRIDRPMAERMAPVAASLSDLGVSVLSSPRLGVEHALRRAG